MGEQPETIKLKGAGAPYQPVKDPMDSYGQGEAGRMPKASDGRPEDRVIPFGYNKGTPLGKVPDKELRSLREWCAERDDEGGTRRFDDLIAAIDEVIENRQGLPLGLDE